MDENVLTSGRVDIDGRHIAYKVIGPAEGPAVVLLHALASQSATWRDVGLHLSEHGFRVVAFDLPGHGASARSNDYSLDSLAGDISAAMKQLGLGSVSLVGHSLGAQLATRIAAMPGSRVRALILEAVPVPPKTPVEARAMTADHQQVNLWRAIRLLGWRRLARIIFFRAFDPRVSKLVVAELGAPAPQWWASLPRIGVPTLVMCNATDGPISDRAALVASAIPNARVELLGEGHHLHGDHLEAFLAVLVPFLKAPGWMG
ncbi:alpha/beta hydrolase [Luteibacter aegosomaticola]|uniref:alpha/beta fold hydrolase n=1 Tax=Luteibacter aegosomaticola TaxID=2911538 RepID=UPI001FF9E091|nr:alpha/beta hydrolase [Luteibacter aegosomaticola]UPG92175.1 alpha/beta hydrolase [Luteibacter aegosomaticola]